MEPRDPTLDALARCVDLREVHIAQAIAARAETRALLARLSQISAPGTGAAKTLLVYARMATTACDWIDGDLRIDLTADASATVVEAYTELGGGLLERLFAPIRFDAPLVEFSRAIARVPQMIAPLSARGSSERRIVLSATDRVRKTTAPPPPLRIASESLFLGVPRAPPTGGVEPGEGLLPVIAAYDADGDEATDGGDAGLDAGWDD